MADVFSPEKRSEVMSKIRSKNTRPEERVRKWLFKKGFRYRKNVTALPGKPDVVLARYKAVVFVHGCFWHGHDGCKYYRVPKTRAEWWLAKINHNRKRDEEVQAILRACGWKVFVLWECELRRAAEVDVRLEKLAMALRGQQKQDVLELDEDGVH